MLTTPFYPNTTSTHHAMKPAMANQPTPTLLYTILPIPNPSLENSPQCTHTRNPTNDQRQFCPFPFPIPSSPIPVPIPFPYPIPNLPIPIFAPQKSSRDYINKKKLLPNIETRMKNTPIYQALTGQTNANRQCERRLLPSRVQAQVSTPPSAAVK